MSNEIQTVTPINEVSEIAAYRQDIELWFSDAPVVAIQAALDAVKGVSIAACAEGPEAGVEAVKAAKKSLADTRLRIAADNQKRFKAPVNAIGKRIDARNRELLAMIEPREAELAAELDAHAAMLERIKQEEEARRKALVNARLQWAMQNGVVVDATDAEQMPEDEWSAHCAALLEDKKQRESEEAKRAEAQRLVQARIISRMEAAGKLGASLSREDAEYLTDEEFESLADGWRKEHDERVRLQAQREEVQSLKDRASAQGFLLLDQDIAGWEDKEAGFMLWMAEKVKARQKEQADKQKQERMLERSALLKDGESVSVKVLMEATPEEWSAIYRQILEDRTAREAAPVAPTAAPAVPATATIPQQLDMKQEALSICQDFAAFGRSLPTEELKAALRPVYNRMKQLAERL